MFPFKSRGASIQPGRKSNGKSWERYLDTYALTRNRLWEGICDACKKCLAAGDSLLAVAHFVDTFSAMQSELERCCIPYRVSRPRVDLAELDDWASAREPGLLLTLASALDQPHPSTVTALSAGRLAVAVIERHPHPEPDERLQSILRAYPGQVRLGYYVAIDDAVVQQAIPPALVQVMKQFGLNDHSLVTSSMLTKRLDQVIARRGRQLSSWQQADSPEEWFALNSAAATADRNTNQRD